MGVRIFSNEDIDAPVLKDQPGSLINILKACLIDGYGTGADETLPHGAWEVITDSTGRKGAFRSTDANANGFWFYIDDNANNTADVGMAEVFTGFDASDVPNNDTTWMVTPGPSWQKTASPDISPWKVIADERFFYWIHMAGVDQSAFDNNGWAGAWAGSDTLDHYNPSNGSYQWGGWQTAGNGFGDLINTSPSDTDATILSRADNFSASTGTNNANGSIGRFDALSDTGKIARDARGTNQGVDYTSQYSGDNEQNSGASGSASEVYPAPNTPQGIIISSQPTIYSRIGTTFNSRFRGQLPGIFPVPLRIGKEEQQGFGADFVKWGTYTTPFNNTPYSGRTFTMTGLPPFRNSSFEPSIVFVDLTGPWR